MISNRDRLTEFVRSNTPHEPPPLRESATRSRGPWLLCAVAAVALIVTGGCWLMIRADHDSPHPDVLDPDSGSPKSVRVLASESGESDRYPNRSTEDWATYAEYVIQFTVVDDRAEPVSASEARRGEGMISRSITARVDATLWTSPNADRPAPAEIGWDAWGWIFDGDPALFENLTPAVPQGTSRLEAGHSYIAAITFEEARCAPGDKRVPASWVPLGAGAIVPTLDGVIGVGEFEGRERTLSEAIKDRDVPTSMQTVGQQFAGRSLDELRAALNGARIGEAEPFTEPAPC